MNLHLGGKKDTNSTLQTKTQILRIKMLDMDADTVVHRKHIIRTKLSPAAQEGVYGKMQLTWQQQWTR